MQQDQQSTKHIKGVWLWKPNNQSAACLLVDNMPHMSAFHNLTHLGLPLCYLTPETCNTLSKHTIFLQHLECLDLSINDIGKGGAINLITALTEFSPIRELDLQYTGLGLEDCNALRELLATSKYIEVLDIRGNGLSSNSIQLIVDGLSHNTSLEEISIRESNFSLENVLHLTSVLRMNTRLKGLDIQWCAIECSDSVHLAKALEDNTTTQLQTLMLNGNSIGSEGAAAFAGMLKKNQCLKMLKVSDDSVGVESALELVESLKCNATLKKLEPSKNCIPDSFSALDKTLQDRVTFSYMY